MHPWRQSSQRGLFLPRLFPGSLGCAACPGAADVGGQRDAPPLPWLPSGCFPPGSILRFPVAPSSSHRDPRVPASGSLLCAAGSPPDHPLGTFCLGFLQPPVTGPRAQLALRDTPNLRSSGSPVAVILPRPKGRPSLASLEALVPSITRRQELADVWPSAGPPGI